MNMRRRGTTLASNLLSRRSVTTLRKDLIPFIKLIHPDHFLSHSPDIQRENMKFLQSLNEMSDCLQSISQKYHQSESVEINQPLMKTYLFSFYVKVSSTSAVTTETENSGSHNNGESKEKPEITENDFRKVKLFLTTPSALSTRSHLTQARYKTLVKQFLSQLGQLFELVQLPSPWKKMKGAEGTELDEEGDLSSPRVSRYDTSTSSPSNPSQWNFIRRHKEVFSGPEIEQVIQEHQNNRKMEREALWMWDTKPEELERIIHSFHYILPQTTPSSSSSLSSKQSRRRNHRHDGHGHGHGDRVSRDDDHDDDTELLSSYDQITQTLYPTHQQQQQQSTNRYSRNRSHSQESIVERKFTEHEIQRMIEINRFILNGHVFVHSLASKEIEVEVLNTFRVFLFDYYDILNFNYRQWGDVIFILTGESSHPVTSSTSTSTSTEKIKKKLSKYEKEIQSYRQERIHSNPSSSTPPASSSSATATSDPLSPPPSSRSKGHILLTIPFNFSSRILSSYLTRHLSSHTNFLLDRRAKESVNFMEDEV
jgi:hypothetical protein